MFAFAVAVIAAAASLVLTLLIMFTNMMSDAPADGFQGTDVIVVLWVLTLGCWAVFAVPQIWY